jgi:hypothetical protein
VQFLPVQIDTTLACYPLPGDEQSARSRFLELVPAQAIAVKIKRGSPAISVGS